MKHAYPTGRFWIKDDGCQTSTSAISKRSWNGNADLGDGKLQELRTDYEERIKDIKNLVSLQDNVETVLVELDKVAANLA